MVVVEHHCDSLIVRQVPAAFAKCLLHAGLQTNNLRMANPNFRPRGNSNFSQTVRCFHMDRVEERNMTQYKLFSYDQTFAGNQTSIDMRFPDSPELLKSIFVPFFVSVVNGEARIGMLFTNFVSMKPTVFKRATSSSTLIMALYSNFRECKRSLFENMTSMPTFLRYGLLQGKTRTGLGVNKQLFSKDTRH